MESADKIRRLREQTGMTRKDFSIHIGIPLRTIECLSSEALYHFTNLWFNRMVFPFIRPIPFSPHQSYQRTV